MGLRQSASHSSPFRRPYRASPGRMQDKTRSLRALDFLNFFNAGIQTGLGPFIAIFYQMARHWNPGQIGTLLAVQSLAGILVQAYIGDRVDQSKHKRMIAAVAAMVVTLGCLGIALLPSFIPQIGVQAIIGVAITVFPAATASFALGLEKRKISRNGLAGMKAIRTPETSFSR